ncbi:MAG: pilin [Candidatus Gracilibacteria bacterium]|nr:pilin [Candidatus Gracilibacteria bacterium]
MKTIIKSGLGLSLLFITKVSLAVDGGVFGDNVGDKLRTGDVHLSDIPQMIRNAIDFLMGFAGTIAIIFVIIGAYKILFGSLEQDKTKGRDTIIMALGGFALAALAWFIVKVILDNLA